MEAITVKQAEADLRAVIRRVLENLEPTVVTTEGGESVVLLSLEEFNAWQETLYLLSTPANAEHLRRSIAEDKAGYTQSRHLSDQ